MTVVGRAIVVPLAGFLIVFAALWLLLLFASGMGDGDRGPLSMAAFIALEVFVPAMATVFLAWKSISASLLGDTRRAGYLLMGAFLPIPMVYALAFLGVWL